ncbi:MAG: hypothetical protein AAF645_26820 [Myxococcota bacterium]
MLVCTGVLLVLKVVTLLYAAVASRRAGLRAAPLAVILLFVLSAAPYAMPPDLWWLLPGLSVIASAVAAVLCLRGAGETPEQEGPRSLTPQERAGLAFAGHAVLDAAVLSTALFFSLFS